MGGSVCSGSDARGAAGAATPLSRSHAQWLSKISDVFRSFGSLEPSAVGRWHHEGAGKPGTRGSREVGGFCCSPRCFDCACAVRERQCRHLRGGVRRGARTGAGAPVLALASRSEWGWLVCRAGRCDAGFRRLSPGHPRLAPNPGRTAGGERGGGELARLCPRLRLLPGPGITASAPLRASGVRCSWERLSPVPQRLGAAGPRDEGATTSPFAAAE